MKGPAATTLYGTEAANGVIQIITKKGAIGKTTWDFNTRQGANWFSNPQGRLWTKLRYVNAAGRHRQRELHAARKDYSDAVQGAADLHDRLSTGLRPRTRRRHLRYFAITCPAATIATRASSRRTTTISYTARANLGIFPNDKIDIPANAGYNVNKTNLAAEAGYGGTTWTTYYADPANDRRPSHLGFHSGLPAGLPRAISALPGDQPLYRQRRRKPPSGLLVQPAPRARHRRRLRGQRGAERDPSTISRTSSAPTRIPASRTCSRATSASSRRATSATWSCR